MNRALITGGSGFFGGLLKRRLLADGVACVNIDLVKDEDSHPLLTSIHGDICEPTILKTAFDTGKFDVIFHVAAQLVHGVKDEKMLWASNVEGTESIARAAVANGVRKIVFTSTNCLWARGFNRPVTEEDPPEPIETYGRSKMEAERILQKYNDQVQSVIIRCPTIIDSGRMGLLAILFQFIDEGRKVWLVGGGRNCYQFIDAGDLASACIAASDYDGSGIFNVGSDNVKSLRQVYQYVIDRENRSTNRVAAERARVVHDEADVPPPSVAARAISLQDDRGGFLFRHPQDQGRAQVVADCDQRADACQSI